MRRSPWVTGVIVVQILTGILLAGLSVFLLALTRSTAIRQETDAAGTISGLKIAAAMFGPPALVVLAGAYGMRKAKLWGWWVALLSDLGLIAICAYNLVDEGWGQIDWELVLFAVIPVLGTILLLAPVVRSFYWRRQEVAQYGG